MFSMPMRKVAVELGQPEQDALEMDIDDPALEAAKDDVAAVLGHRRAHAGVEQLLDLRDDLGVLLAALGGRRRRPP